MSARDEAVEMIRRICPPHLSADEYGQILAEKFDAHRAEVLNEAAAAAESSVALFEGSDETAAAAGAMEGLAIRFRRMASEEATAAAATATPEAFFIEGRVYARQHHGRTIEFHVIHVATAPDCEFPTAFGWRKDPEIDVMLPMDADDFHGCGWVDVTKAGDGS